jgi:signal transduction histidine kinase
MACDGKTTHDVRNQLTIVRGFAELLLADMQHDDPRRGDVEEIHTAAQKALALVAAISDASDAPKTV